MITIAFFNNKGGVGKTTLVYHLANMFSDLGHTVVVADFDPQANLTAASLTDQEINEVEEDRLPSIYDVVAPLIAEGRSEDPPLIEVNNTFHLIPGDLRLSSIEDALSGEWTKCLSDSSLDKVRAFKVTTCLARAVKLAGQKCDTDIALIDIGPNLGAINRSALIGADFVVIPVAPDIFSLQGLTNVGEGLREWRRGWDRRLEDAPLNAGGWPHGQMKPVGYVVSRFSTYAGEKSAHFRRWINRVPEAFQEDILRSSRTKAPLTVEEDKNCLAWLKEYRSLMPMAQEARKPIFELRPGDGAIGAHQTAVRQAYLDFQSLAETISEKVGL